MHYPDEELRKAVALFRYGLIADVLRLAPGSPDIGRTLHEKAQRTYVIPGTRRTRVAVETMRDWLSLYRTGGFEALYPKTRAERGPPRRLPPEVAEWLIALKTEQPALSVKALIGAARERGVEHPLAPSTVHRLLSREGLFDSRPGEPVATDRRRFALRDAGALSMSDVMHGPKVRDGRRRRKSFLIAFIDDATRVLPFAAFAHAHNTTAFLPVCKQAIARRGLPMRLFVDNGANDRSQPLALVCAKLAIALIHPRPCQPAGKGNIERFFRTLRAAVLAHLTAEATESLHTLNRTVWAWVEGEYPLSPHRGLDGRTPLDPWALAGHNVRSPDPGTITGEVGSGKTTVCRHIASALHPRLHRVGYLSLTTGNVLDMDKAIAWVLGLPTERARATAYRAIGEEITPRVGEAKPLPVLVIDEAQHLRNDVLEDLRLLTHFAIACHESLAQRLVVRHPLAGIERCELDHSLAHRLHLAGCELPLFEPPAIEALAHSTRGLPRLINRTAHYALTAAAAQGARTVTAEHLEHAVAQLRL